MVDISDSLNEATSTPKQAADNIQAADIFAVNPTNDADTNNQLVPAAKQMMQPKEAEPPVANYAQQSSEHAAMVRPDLEKLNYVSRLMKYFGDKIGRGYSDGEEAAHLGFKQMMQGGQLNDDDTNRLYDLQQSNKDFAERNYDLNGPPTPPQDMFDYSGAMKTGAKAVADVAAGAVNMAHTAVRGSLEALLNSDNVPYLSQLPPYVRTALGSMGYLSDIGAKYNEMPPNMDEGTKRNLSIGLSTIQQVPMLVAPEIMESMAPFLRSTISPAFVKMAMEDPANALFRQASYNIGKSVAAMGTAQFANESVNIIGDEMKKNYDGTHASFMQAIQSAAQKVVANQDDYRSRLEQAGGEGALSGLLFGVAGNAIGARGMKAQINDIAQRGYQMVDYVNKNYDLSKMLPGDIGPEPAPTPEGPRPPPKDITPKRPNIGDEIPIEQTVNPAVNSLKFHEGLNIVNDIMNDTEMSKASPTERASFLKMVFDRAGISKLYTTISNSRIFSSSPEKEKAIKSLIDPDGNWAGQMSQPIPVDPEKVMHVAQGHPDILDHFTPDPTNLPIPLSAKTHLENIVKRNEGANKLLTDLGVASEDIQQAPPHKFNINDSNKKVAEHLGTPERADQAQEFFIDQHANASKAIEEAGGVGQANTRDILAKKDAEAALQKIEGARKALAASAGDKGDVKGQGEKDSFDFAATAKRTGELLAEKKAIEGRGPDSETAQADKAQLKKIHAELEDIKGKVTEAFRKNNPKAVYGNWPEPGIEGPNIDNAGEETHSYLTKATFPQAIRKLLGDKLADRINVAQLEARENRVGDLTGGMEYEMDRVHDQAVAQQREIRLQQEYEKLKDDPNIAIAEKFRGEIKAKNPIFKIDVNSLSKEQVEFADENKNALRSVFARKKGTGSHVDSLAQLVGAKDGDHLLQILAHTPDRDQLAKFRAVAYGAEDENEIRSQDDADYQRYIEALRDPAKNHLAELKFLLENDWPGLKAGIKAVALNHTPTIEEVESEVRQHLKDMTLDQISRVTKQAEIGRQRSYRAAIASILRNEFPAAGEHLLYAAKNAALRREAMIATRKINKGFAFFRRMNRPGPQAVLRNDKSAYDAFTEIEDYWRMSPSKAGLAERDSFAKFVKKQMDLGHGDFSIPDRLSVLQGREGDNRLASIPERLKSVQQSAMGMTLEQFEAVTDRARGIYKEAQLTKKLQALESERQKEEYEQGIQDTIDQLTEHLKGHPGYNVKKIPPVLKIPGWFRNWRQSLLSIEKVTTDRTAIIQELDKFQTDGIWHRTIEAGWEDGYEFMRGHQKEDMNKIIDLAEEHTGLKGKAALNQFSRRMNTLVDIPEFEGKKGLQRDMTIGSLMRAYGYLGTADSKAKLLENNGGLSEEKWLEILERHLTPKDVQAMHRKFQMFRDRTAEIQERQKADGRDTEMIEGIPITLHGVTRMGGYTNIETAEDLRPNDLTSAKNFFDEKHESGYAIDDGSKWGRHYAAESTKQGHLISRVDHSLPLDLSIEGVYRGLYQINSDLAYRVTARNTFNLLNNKELYAHLVATIGPQKAEMLVQNFLGIIGRARSDGMYNDVEQGFKKAMTVFNGKFARANLLANFHTIFKQGESWFEYANRHGVTGLKHLARAIWLTHKDGNLGAMTKIAMELDPAIHQYLAAVQERAITRVNELMPQNSRFAALDWLARTSHMIELGGYGPLMLHDFMIKVWQAHAVSSMFLNGEHKDFPLERIAAMSDEEKYETLKRVVRQESHITTINPRSELQAPGQKNLIFRLIAPFFNFQRRIINNTILDYRRMYWHTQAGMEKLWGKPDPQAVDIPSIHLGQHGLQKKIPKSNAGFKRLGEPDRFDEMREGGEGRQTENDKESAWHDFANAGGAFLNRHTTAMFALMAMGWIYGKTFQAAPINKNDDLAKEGGKLFANWSLAPWEMFSDVYPGISPVKYAAEHINRYQEASMQIPLTQAGADAATCLEALPNLLSLSYHTSQMQKLACLSTENYLPFALPFPARGYVQAKRFWDQLSFGHVGPSQLQMGNLNLNGMNDAKDAAKSFVENPPSGTPKAFIDNVAQLHTQLTTQTSEPPPNASDKIKSAMGPQLFTPEQWRQIQKEAPDLALTGEGRNKPGEQQEKAMDYLIHANAYALSQKDIPVKTETLFGAHKIGLQGYEKLYEASANTKVKSLGISLPLDLQGFKTVGQVKEALKSQLSGAKTAQLTEGASGPED